MEYRVFGRTGAKISRLGIGGAPIGIENYLGLEDRDDKAFLGRAVETVREARRAGVTYFDTAPGYGNGRAESVYGEGLEGARDGVFLATKYAWDPGKPVEDLKAGFAASLERLKTGRVDLLQFHGSTFTDETAEAVLKSGVLEWTEEEKAKGRTRFLGITAEAPSGGLERLMRTGRFDALLVAYNLIYQAACDYQREPFGVIPLARSLGMGVAVMRPTTSGFIQKLFAREFPEVDRGKVTRAALNFVFSTPEVDVAVVGMRSPDEVRQNAALEADKASRMDLKFLHNRFDAEAGHGYR